jgi:hypothetical protein
MTERVIAALVTLALASCNNEKVAKIHFVETQDIFTIAKGALHTSTFKFENKGTDTLRIKSVDATCGCTKTEYDSVGIGPGDQGEIKVVYDSNLDKSNSVQKAVLVESNTTPKLTTLYLLGKIK